MKEKNDLTWLIETNDAVQGASQCLFENDGITEVGIVLYTAAGEIALTKGELQRIIDDIDTGNG